MSAPASSTSPASGSDDGDASDSGRLLARLGVLSDIQYADVPDGHNFLKTERRFYRNALQTTARAVDRMRGLGGASVGEGAGAAVASAATAPSDAAAIIEPEWRCQAVLHLGDLIDGFNAVPSAGGSEAVSDAAVQAIMEVLPPVSSERVVPPLSGSCVPQGDPMACYHLLGNHELMNFPRSRWAREMAFGALSEASRREAERWARANPPPSDAPKREYLFPSSSAPVAAAESNAAASASDRVSSGSPLYYDLLVGGVYRFIMLDAFDVSVSGYGDYNEGGEHPHFLMAQEYLARENPNEIKFSPEGLHGTERRKVAFNGGMSQGQLEYLETVLRRARANKEWAVLCSHVAFHEGASHCSALLWNREEVLRLLTAEEYGADVVVACLHGHDHDGGHCVDEDPDAAAATAGDASPSASPNSSPPPAPLVVHHTFEGVLTTPVGQDTYGRMDLFERRIEVTGVDRLKGFSIDLRNKPGGANRREQQRD